MTNEEPSSGPGPASPDEPLAAEDEGYDEGAGDKITPEDERDTDRGSADDTRQAPSSSTRHLPEDMPPQI